MDASFTIGNAVYNEGTATVVFTDTFGTFPVEGNGEAVTCWMTDATLVSSNSQYTTCAASTSTITVTDLKGSVAGTTFKFRVLATIANGTISKINSVLTSTGTANIDNTTTGLHSWTIATAITLHNNPGITWGFGAAGDGTDMVTAGGPKTGDTDSNQNGFKVFFTASLAIGETTSITIGLPLDT